MAAETGLGRDGVGDLPTVVPGDRGDARIGIELAANGGRGTAAPDHDLGRAVTTAGQHGQPELAGDGAPLGRRGVRAIPNEDLVGRNRRRHRVGGARSRRGDDGAQEQGDGEEERVTGRAHRRSSYAAGPQERDSLDVTGGS